MDLIESLAKQASQITMYDVKSYYNQAKNMVLNLSEMEAKVREATNDDPWGASSTLMQEIADGTHNFAQFNEIMPTIYSRFMEKEAREWRQIYKALTLLEFLVKNGSERVVDDARAHVSTIKMLRSFHYIDEKGKDQGINVRNRASEIALLLGDVDKIRQERRKAKANKTKYQGVGNDGGMSFVTAGGSRYGGFGSETLGHGGGGGGSQYSGGNGYENDDYRPSRSSSRPTAPEYDEYEGADDFDDRQPPRRAPSSSSSRRPNPPPKSQPKPKEAEKPVEKPKEVNLFDFDDDDVPLAQSVPATAPAAGGDDDFDDFQSASATAPAPAAAPAQASKPVAQNNNLFDLLNSNTSSVPAPSTASYAPQSVNQFTSPPSYPSYTPQTAQSAQPVQQQRATQQPSIGSRPSYSSTTSPVGPTPSALSPKPTGGSSTFDDLWTTSLSSLGSGASATTKNVPKKSINDLEKEKAMNTLWGAGGSSGGGGGSGQAQNQANAFGSFGGGGASKPANGSGGGGGDLLL